jgi:acyl-CoA synthetase (AMP-forming)/AMP-acid ligase II
MEAAAFGLPHERLGETPGALVMLKPDPQSRSTPAAALRESVAARLAAFKVPPLEGLFLTERPLPRGATGKILKREIRDGCAARLMAAVAAQPAAARSKL